MGTTLLAGVFLVAGVAGFAAFWETWPRTSNTSPLAALSALTWGCTHVVTATLTWRRSRFAAPVSLAAIGLLVFPARFVAPGAQVFLPASVVIALLALLGFRYLRGVREVPA